MTVTGGAIHKERPMDIARIRQTDRLRLEPIGLRHAEQLWRLYADPAVAEWYGQWTHELVQREVARIAAAWEADGIHKWMAYHRHTGDLVGRGGLSQVQLAGRNVLEIGWVLHGWYWGYGYATEIGREGLACAFTELGAEEVVSFTEPHNARSRAVMERLGFHHTEDRVFEEGGELFALYVLGRDAWRASPPAATRAE
jgi:RimJ/RimL family protein N-acetyltransferase